MDRRPLQHVPARVDLWVVALVVLALFGVALIVTPLLLDARVALGAKALVGTFGAGALLLTLGMAVPVRYWLEPQGLTVRAGALRLRFAYPDIVRADRVISPLSGPAWSLVRVRIALDGGGWIEIAPRDREGFLAELARRAPHLTVAPRGLADSQRVRFPAAAQAKRPRSGGRRQR
jgi:hypothetical protein